MLVSTATPLLDATLVFLEEQLSSGLESLENGFANSLPGMLNRAIARYFLLQMVQLPFLCSVTMNQPNQSSGTDSVAQVLSKMVFNHWTVLFSPRPSISMEILSKPGALPGLRIEMASLLSTFESGQTGFHQTEGCLRQQKGRGQLVKYLGKLY